MIELLWKTDRLPFTVGACSEPQNPSGLPDVLPFALALDTTLGLLIQRSDAQIRSALRTAYRSGSLLGTPMDDTEMGQAYAEDFLRYITLMRDVSNASILEIGCGRGYLLKLLTALGARALGVEPGAENRPYWSKYDVPVVNDYFPAAEIDGQFDCVVCYGVLEHIEDYRSFLKDVCGHLRDGGTLILAVPDERQYIASGDPAMLVHEHFLYCTPMTLSRLLAASGFRVRDIREAGYGAVLYCAAVRDDAAGQSPVAESELAEARRFSAKSNRLRMTINTELARSTAACRSVGIYCPARGLAVLPENKSFRFFDDDPALTGRFYPPFRIAIESRSGLIERPVDDIVILSRTFGRRIKDSLGSEPRLRGCVIKTIDEICNAPQTTGFGC